MPLFVVVTTLLSYIIFFIWGYIDTRHLGTSFRASALIGSATLILTILISIMVGAFANSKNFNEKLSSHRQNYMNCGRSNQSKEFPQIIYI